MVKVKSKAVVLCLYVCVRIHHVIPRAGARDSFVVHLPDIGPFTKLAVWIAEPKVEAAAASSCTAIM